MPIVSLQNRHLFLCRGLLLVSYRTVDYLVILSLTGDTMSHGRNSTGDYKGFIADVAADKVTWNVVRAYYMQLA
jgi:hypothetical protein